MSWWRGVSDVAKLAAGLVAAVLLFGLVVWVNFGPGGDGGDVVAPAATLTAAPRPAPATSDPGVSSEDPSVAVSSAAPADSGTSADPAGADASGGDDTGLLPAARADVDALKAELVEVASAGVVAFFEYGVGDSTALDRLERLRPFIDDTFYDQLDEGYDDPDFDAALEEGLWNTAKVETVQVGHNGDGITPRITDTGVMTVFVDIRQGWLPPGGELDARVHYLRMFEVSLIDTEDGVKIVDIAPASI